MRYLRFTISNYRAVTGPLTIDLQKRSLIPIIGINESGKTTILQAIYAFDEYNDEQLSRRHIEDTGNLQKTPAPSALVEAEIEIPRNEFRDLLIDLSHDDKEH